MLRPSHSLLRWLRLAMACLALAVGGPPAHAEPGPAAPVATLVDRSTSAKAPTGVAQSVPIAPIKAAPAQLAPPAARRAPSRAPGPARRLFLLHRALLR